MRLSADFVAKTVQIGVDHMNPVTRQVIGESQVFPDLGSTVLEGDARDTTAGVQPDILARGSKIAHNQTCLGQKGLNLRIGRRSVLIYIKEIIVQCSCRVGTGTVRDV